MRGLTAFCLGLVVVLGAGAAKAGGSPDEDCFVCECTDDGTRPLCVQGEGFPSFRCEGTCKPSSFKIRQLSDQQCTQVPGCPQFNSRSAPTASPYGIAALLIALGGFGAWRLRKRAA